MAEETSHLSPSVLPLGLFFQSSFNLNSSKLLFCGHFQLSIYQPAFYLKEKGSSSTLSALFNHLRFFMIDHRLGLKYKLFVPWIKCELNFEFTKTASVLTYNFLLKVKLSYNWRLWSWRKANFSSFCSWKLMVCFWIVFFSTVLWKLVQSSRLQLFFLAMTRWKWHICTEVFNTMQTIVRTDRKRHSVIFTLRHWLNVYGLAV